MRDLPSIPGYEVECELGRGGMGIVYKCNHRERGVTLAVKMMLRGRGATFEDLARFRVEAEAYSCLKHPNIVRIRDVGVVEGCPYLATEYAAKGALHKFLSSEPKPIDWRVNVVHDIALALDHAHKRRILHRDLKPANVLVMDDESAKVTDFGLVKFASPIAWVNNACCTFSVAELDQELLRFARELQHDYSSPRQADKQDSCSLVKSLRTACANRTGLPLDDLDETEVWDFLTAGTAGSAEPSEAAFSKLDGLSMDGQVMGSPQYMSPEQAAGELDKISPATDVYGLGATLYQLLTGQAPFSATSLRKLVRNVRDERPVPPQEIRSAISDELDSVICKCLEKEPERRYPDAMSLAEDLSRCLEGRTPLALLDRRSRNSSKDSRTSSFGDLTTLFKRTFSRRGNRDS